MLPRELSYDSAPQNFHNIMKLALAGDKQQLQQLPSINIIDAYGRSVVLAVTTQQNMQALQLLIDLGADVDLHDPTLSVEIIDQTAFLYAGAHGMNDAIDILLAAGAQSDIYNYYGGTALIPAAEKGHIETVRLLLEKSTININHINRLGWTALMEAVILSDGGKLHQQIVTLLLQHGADVSILDKEGVSLLEHAKNRGYTAMYELLQEV